MTVLTAIWDIHSALRALSAKTAVVVYGVDMTLDAADPLDVMRADASRGADLGAWRMLNDKVVELGQEGRLGLLLREGTLTEARWRGIAQVAWDGLVDLQASAGVSSVRFAALWSEVVIPTAVTVADKSTQAVEAAKDSFWPLLILVVVGLVALAVIRVR